MKKHPPHSGWDHNVPEMDPCGLICLCHKPLNFHAAVKAWNKLNASTGINNECDLPPFWSNAGILLIVYKCREHLISLTKT